MSETKKNRWRRLDNTAKIFPVISNENVSQVFRISVTLKEEINPGLLQQAVEEILPQIRNFRVKLRRGLFWYYFEENPKIPQVTRENTYPCRYIDPHGNQRFLFRVTYYERRINLEVFHALTDGLGAVTLLKLITQQYLDLVHAREGEAPNSVGEDQEKMSHPLFSVDDSYISNYRDIPYHSYSSRPAYHMSGNFLPLGTGQVLHGYVNTNELKKICHKYDVSITKYLVATLVWSIWQEYLDGKACRKPIMLNLPINLRAFFGSDTMANFFAVSLIGFLFSHPNTDFSTLVDKISRQMDRKIQKEKLEESIAYNVSNEKKWYLRIVPLFIKAPVTALIFHMKEKAYTMTLSNVGPIKMDERYMRDIERFHLMIGVSRRQPIKCAVCAYGEEMVITFTSVFADSRLQKRFFGKLKEDGLAIGLEGNELCAAKRRVMYPRIRKVLILRKGGEEKAARMARSVGHTGVVSAKGMCDYISGKRNWREELKRRFHI